MTSYPKWWNDTVTLYNRIENATTHEVTWQRTVISNCFASRVTRRVIVDKTLSVVQTHIVRIRESADYLSPSAWNDATTRTGKFTLQVGDLVVFGTVADTISEYTAGQTSEDVLNKYINSGAFRVSVAKDNTDAAGAHYYGSEV